MNFKDFKHKKTVKKNSKVNSGIFESESLDMDDVTYEDTIQLFDGYLGEKNFDPNPLEYGPNAMYRKNGTVYRKSVDNLWEAYLKDGSPGARGSAGGSGVGVQEVQRLANDLINTAISSIVISGGTTSDAYLPLSGGTLTGRLITPLLSSTNISANDINILYNGANDLLFTNALLEVFDKVDNYSQIAIQNQSSGTNSSTDIVATSNVGTDSSNYIDLGINGSNYNVSGWKVNGQNDGYLYVAGGNLSLGTSTSGKSLDIFTGGTLSANKILTFNDSIYKISATLNPVTYFHKQAGWMRRVIFSKFLGSSVTTVSESDILASATGPQQIDGNYPGSHYGIPPIIRANAITSGNYWLRSHGMFGLNMGSNASNVIIREYWGNVKVSEITINKSDFDVAPTSSNNFPLEVINRYNWESGAINTAALRVHNTIITGNGKGIVKCSESYFTSYPIVNLLIDLPIRWTAQWSHSDCFLFTDNIEYEL